MYLRVNSENEWRIYLSYIISNNSQNKDWRVERIIEKERKFFRITIYGTSDETFSSQKSLP